MFEFEKIVVFICNLLKKSLEKIRKNSNQFEKIRKTSWLKIRNSIRFEGKIIRFVRFEKFSIRLIRKYFFNSKNSRKINSKFVRFDSTPPLFQPRRFSYSFSVVWKKGTFWDSLMACVKVELGGKGAGLLIFGLP